MQVKFGSNFNFWRQVSHKFPRWTLIYNVNLKYALTCR